MKNLYAKNNLQTNIWGVVLLLIGVWNIAAASSGYESLITITQEKGRQILVIKTKQDPKYQSFLLTNPPRLVIDVEDVLLQKQVIDISNNQLVEKVRVGEFKPGVMRIVVDLKHSVSYKIVNNPGTLEIHLYNIITEINFTDEEIMSVVNISFSGEVSIKYGRLSNLLYFDYQETNPGLTKLPSLQKIVL